MKKSIPTLIATLVWSALYSQHTLANLYEQCLLNVPRYDKPLVSGNYDELPINIQADKSDAHYPNLAIFSGHVNIQQGNSTLSADQVVLQQHDTAHNNATSLPRAITATGNVIYANNLIQLHGPEVQFNLDNNNTDISNANYQFVGRQGRGFADLIQTRDKNRYLLLENGTFTSCLPNDNSWSVTGSKIIEDRQEQVAEIWNARFKIGSVPVFYTPYLQLPTGDKRRSGFLLPTVRYSSEDGLGLTLPWYWNISPQADATITPHYIQQRGLQLQNEFRYLTLPGSGLIAFDYLNNDRKYNSERQDKGESENSNTKRWLLYWQHNGVLEHVWRFDVDYTRVSDPDYFSNLDSKHGSSTDGYATQKLSVGYGIENWNVALSTTQFQVFANAGNTSSYRTAPQFDVNYYQENIGPFDFHLYGQAVKFKNDRDNMPNAERYHFAPSLSLPLVTSWGSLNTETHLLTTYYQQNIPQNDPGYRELSPTVTRVIPELKVDGKMIFQRDLDLASGYIQTLEPRMQYLYLPFRDQSNIYNYDSTLLQTDYTGLFRDRTYSGLDRIASANQVATGITNRLYDNSFIERFNLSLGQIYYFSAARTGDETINFDKESNTGSLVWAGDSYWKINKVLSLRGGLQYDPRLDSISIGDAIVEYRKSADSVLQLNYRYASSEYVTATVPTYQDDPQYKKGISQIGMIGSTTIAARWAWVGSYYYDTNTQQTADALVGLQYNTCCWSVGLGYQRQVVSWDSRQLNSKYDNKLLINFSLRGLNQNQSLGTAEMLRSSILPYQRAF